jgi:hypothetical protein
METHWEDSGIPRAEEKTVERDEGRDRGRDGAGDRRLDLTADTKYRMEERVKALQAIEKVRAKPSNINARPTPSAAGGAVRTSKSKPKGSSSTTGKPKAQVSKAAKPKVQVYSTQKGKVQKPRVPTTTSIPSTSIATPPDASSVSTGPLSSTGGFGMATKPSVPSSVGIKGSIAGAADGDSVSKATPTKPAKKVSKSTSKKSSKAVKNIYSGTSKTTKKTTTVSKHINGTKSATPNKSKKKSVISYNKPKSRKKPDSHLTSTLKKGFYGTFVNIFDALGDSWIYSPGENHTVSHDCRIFDDPKNLQRERKLRVVVSSDHKYLANLLNWLVFFLRVCKDVSILYLVCYDLATDDVMRAHGLKCSKIFKDHQRVWYYRTDVTRSLLVKGYDVIISDSDALWIGNPIDTINSFNGYDFVGSRGTFPDQTTKYYGASYCMGFAYIKSNAQTIEMYTDITNQMSKDRNPDDQMAINLYLKKNKLVYDTKPTMTGTEPRYGKLNMPGTGMFRKQLKVVSAPQRMFRRWCFDITQEDLMNTVVVHCYGSAKEGNDKQAVSKKMGLWAIKTDWKTVPFGDHDINSFLMTISDRHALDEISAAQRRYRRRRRRRLRASAEEEGELTSA